MIRIDIVDNGTPIEDITDTLEGMGCVLKSTERLGKASPNPNPKLKQTPYKKPQGCCGQGSKSPSMLKKAKNYAKTMAKWIQAGRPVVTLEVLAERLSVCATCPSLIKDRECSECGCPMIVKAEMGIDKLCELNKW